MVVPARPRAEGYGVAIGDEWYRLAPSTAAPIRIVTRDSLAPRTDDQDSDENVLDVGHAFSRSDLTGGEGLDFYPRPQIADRQPRDKTRYWDSSNLVIERPIAGHPHTMRLCAGTETWWTPGTPPADMAQGGGQLYVIVGDTVHRFANLADITADETDDINVTLLQVVAGNDGAVAVLDTNGDVWYKAPSVSTYLRVYNSASDGPALDAKAIWLVKGRIIAYCDDTATAGEGVMLEISPVITGTTGSPALGATTYMTVDTFPSLMLDCVDAGHAIVAAFSDGSIRSYVPIADNQGGTPDLTIKGRTQMPQEEVPYRLAYNAGTVLVFTLDANTDHVRLYSGTVLDDRFDFVVGQLQLERTWHESAESYPAYTANAMSTRDAIYFWMGETTSEWNLWKYDLVTQGLVRERGDARTSRPVGTVRFEDALTFIVGANVIRETDTFVPEGYLITPNINFGLNTLINFTAFILEAMNLEGGAEVELLRSTDETAILDPNHASWVTVTTVIDAAQSGVEQQRINVTANTLALQLRVRASSSLADSPEVPRFAMRAIPKHRDWAVEIPINCSDYVEAPGRMPLRITGEGQRIQDRVFAQQGQSTVMQLLDPDLVLVGVVHNLGLPVDYRSERGSQSQYVVVSFLGSRLVTIEEVAAIGADGLGLDTLGLVTWGEAGGT